MVVYSDGLRPGRAAADGASLLDIGMTDYNINRRDFLKGVGLTSVGLAMAAEELVFTEQPASAQGAPVTFAVIGLGPQGREILSALAKVPNCTVAAICDNYTSEAYVKRAQTIVPSATFVDDYKKVLDNKAVQGVFVATPTHLHKQIVLDAIAAGKHVYCEAPLAVDLAEAKAIAQAGAAAKTIFQAGLQYRANKMHNHVVNFYRAGAAGHNCGGRGQWHQKGSWKRPAPTPDREAAINWRLKKATSLGVEGEQGIHSLDVFSWYQKALPLSIFGAGATNHWTSDGMEVPDTIQLMLEYPNAQHYLFDATLVSSYNVACEVFMGSNCSILIRDQRSWMFKETDSPLLGWEVYAKKEPFLEERGIALVADSTQLLAQGKEPGKVGADVTKTAVYYAAEAFANSIRTGKKPIAGALEGYQATVVAAKAHEAVMTGSKVQLAKELFDL